MYKRIILKLSGESLSPTVSSKQACFDAERVNEVARAIVKLADTGVQLGIVMGGGNIWRGRFTDEMDPVTADQMGMLATIINSMAVKDAIIRLGKRACVLTAQEMTRFAELYRADIALAKMEAGEIVLLAGGTGNPFFTTDTTAVLRAAELKADVVFKGTKEEGVYDRDPSDENAVLLKHVTYDEAIEKGLEVMDQTAFTMCKKQGVPEVRVFLMDDIENVLRVAAGEEIGSTVRHKH